MGKGSEAISTRLRFHPDMCLEETAIFPFNRPFFIILLNPDHQCLCNAFLVDFHTTMPDRHHDLNINPRRTEHAWTSGIEHKFERDAIHALNSKHIIVKLVAL